MSLASSRNTDGFCNRSSMPMGITVSWPDACSPGATTWATLAAPNVTVAWASSTGSGDSPVSASTPDTTSHATIRGPVGLVRWNVLKFSTSAAASPRSPPDAPVPSMASRTRCADVIFDRAWPRSTVWKPAIDSWGSASGLLAASWPSSLTTDPPSARNALSPCGCALEPVRIAVTITPARRRNEPAHRPSPPLFPEPTRMTAVVPDSNPLRLARRKWVSHTRDSPRAARRIRISPYPASSRGCSAARTLAPVYASITPGTSRSFGHDKCHGHPAVVGDRHVPRLHTAALGHFCHRTRGV